MYPPISAQPAYAMYYIFRMSFHRPPPLVGRFSLTRLCKSALTTRVALDVIEPMVSSARWAIASVASDEVLIISALTSSIAADCTSVSSTRHDS